MLSDFFIGGIAGVISRTMTAPLELYKMQRQNTFMPGSTMRMVIKDEGIRYLWKGNGTNCIRVFPQSAINYSVYTISDECILHKIKNDKIRRFISGTMGGTVSMILTYPLETVRTRLSLQQKGKHYTGINDAILKIPIRDMFRGLGTSIVGYAPFTAISFTSYYSYRDWLDERSYLANDCNKLIAGGFSGLTAIMITYPTDLIRRRLQLQNFDPNVPFYNGINDCIYRITVSEGVCGLYRGLFATCLKLYPTIAIQFYIMDKLNMIQN